MGCCRRTDVNELKLRMIQKSLHISVALNLIHVELDGLLVAHIAENITQIAIQTSAAWVAYRDYLNVFQLTVGFDMGD